MNDTVPAIRGDDHAAIEGWLERLWAEHGLSDRTLSAYRSDLGGFARWQASRDSSLDAADREALERYLASRKVSARSNARLLSALRRYFADRVRRQPGSADPTAASKWIGNLPAGAVKTSARNGLAVRWAALDQTAAGEWVNSQKQCVCKLSKRSV